MRRFCLRLAWPFGVPRAIARRMFFALLALLVLAPMAPGGGGGVLSVIPLPGVADVVSVSGGFPDGFTVTVNGVATGYPWQSVSMIVVDGRASGSLDFSNASTLQSVVYGGGGLNTFTSTGEGMNSWFGGNGVGNVFHAGPGWAGMFGGTSPNIFDTSSVGDGFIFEVGSSNMIVGPTDRYVVAP